MTKKWTGVILEATDAHAFGPMFREQPIASLAPDHGSAKPEQDRSAPTRALAIAETRGDSHLACVNWLAEIMRASPEKRTESREELWEKAHGKWPKTLSHRRFLAAREEAIRLTGAVAWATGGAPAKPQRLNRGTR
jgi:hypothetical protein